MVCSAAGIALLTQTRENSRRNTGGRWLVLLALLMLLVLLVLPIMQPARCTLARPRCPAARFMHKAAPLGNGSVSLFCKGKFFRQGQCQFRKSVENTINGINGINGHLRICYMLYVICYTLYLIDHIYEKIVYIATPLNLQLFLLLHLMLIQSFHVYCYNI